MVHTHILYKPWSVDDQKQYFLFLHTLAEHIIFKMIYHLDTIIIVSRILLHRPEIYDVINLCDVSKRLSYIVKIQRLY